MLHAALPFLMLVAVAKQTTFYHQLEAQHPSASPSEVVPKPNILSFKSGS